MLLLARFKPFIWTAKAIDILEKVKRTIGSLQLAFCMTHYTRNQASEWPKKVEGR